MGITGLLPFLKKIHSPVNVSQFKGCTVAIDAYCWLHKGAFSCAEKLAMGEDTDQYVHYCMKYVNYLLKHDLKPILVFDGCHLPSKREVEKARREKREMNRKRAAQLMREGKRAEARECLQRSVDITPQMALKLMTCCRQRGVDCIVAPYEADAQLAYLAKAGVAQLVITEDSDLLLFGCPRVIFKMDYNGNGIMIEQSRLNEVTDIQNGFYTFDRFRYMCILSGCDYLSSLPNIGLAKACKVFKTTHQQDIRQVLRKLPLYLKGTSHVPGDYIEGFVKANNTFLYQLCFDPIQRKLIPLNPYPPEVDPAELSYCGPPMPDHVALQVALGNIDLYTKEKMNSFDPDKPQPCTKGGQPRPPVAADHRSMWSPKYRQRSAVLATVQPGETPPTPTAWHHSSPHKRPKSLPRLRVLPASEEPAEVCTDAELVDMYSHTLLRGASKWRAAASHTPVPPLPTLPHPSPHGSPVKFRPQDAGRAANEASPKKRNVFALSPSHKKPRFDVNMTKEVRSRYFMFSDPTKPASLAGGEAGAEEEGSCEGAREQGSNTGARSEEGGVDTESKDRPTSQWEEPPLPKLVSRGSPQVQSLRRPTQRTNLEQFAKKSANSTSQAGSTVRNSKMTVFCSESSMKKSVSASASFTQEASDSKECREGSPANGMRDAKAPKRKSSDESLQESSDASAAKKRPVSPSGQSSGRKFSGSAFQWSSFALSRKEGLMASKRSSSQETRGLCHTKHQAPPGHSSSSESAENEGVTAEGNSDCLEGSNDSRASDGMDCTTVFSSSNSDSKTGKDASAQQSSSSVADAAEDVSFVPCVSWTDFLMTMDDSKSGPSSSDDGSVPSSNRKEPLDLATYGSWKVDGSKSRPSPCILKEGAKARGRWASSEASPSTQLDCPESESSQQLAGLHREGQKLQGRLSSRLSNSSQSGLSSGSQSGPSSGSQSGPSSGSQSGLSSGSQSGLSSGSQSGLSSGSQSGPSSGSQSGPSSGSQSGLCSGSQSGLSSGSQSGLSSGSQSGLSSGSQSGLSSGSQSGLSSGSQSGPSSGSQSGLSSGSQSGLSSGRQSGLSSGSQSGLSSGSQSGLSSGSQSGLSSCSQSGLCSGSQSGLSSGRQSGLSSGRQSGLSSGRQSGLSSGRQSGLSSPGLESSPPLDVVDLTQETGGCGPSSQSSKGSPPSSQRSSSSASSSQGVHKLKKACRVSGLSRSKGKLVPDKGQMSIKDMFAKQRQ